MNNTTWMSIIGAAAIALGLSPKLAAEKLQVERVKAAETMNLPVRGQTMQQVEAKFGKPVKKHPPRGGQKPQWPVINRWEYSSFIVFFEKERVIDAVVLSDAKPVKPEPKPAKE